MKNILKIMSKAWLLMSAIWMSLAIICLYRKDFKTATIGLIMLAVCEIMKRIIRGHCD